VLANCALGCTCAQPIADEEGCGPAPENGCDPAPGEGCDLPLDLDDLPAAVGRHTPASEGLIDLEGPATFGQDAELYTPATPVARQRPRRTLGRPVVSMSPLRAVMRTVAVPGAP
jgi:hypothetical protein